MKTREQINAEFKELLIKEKDVIAVWEGGSAATGFLDEYSDLDLAIVCEDEAVEKLFKLIEEHIEKNFGIIQKFRIPEPAWHGFSQCFYRIGNVPELYYLDIALIKRSIPNKFTEKDRHGESVVWFEKEPVIDPAPTPEDAVKAKGKRIYAMTTSYDFLSVTELKKAVARKLFAEAFQQYYQILSRNLGVMLNLKYRPCKADFGTRYFYRELPGDVFEEFQDYLKICSMEELTKKSEKLISHYESIKNELKKDWQ